MKYNPDIHHRQSIRLDNFDYTQNNAYFITVCIWRRNILFGEIIDGKMIPNQFGEIVMRTWEDLPNHNEGILLDVYAAMPDHFHGIIMLNNSNEAPQGNVRSLTEVIRQFKTFSARRINEQRNTRGVPVWQRNYYERIIRSDELDTIRRYIHLNPKNREKELLVKYPELREMYDLM
jgi:REP element-mobilizing transposase RayT